MTKRGPPRTHCKRGHDMSGENLRFDHRGVRICKICEHIGLKDYQNRKRAAGLMPPRKLNGYAFKPRIRKAATVMERLMAYHQVNERGCWIWQRALTHGYGYVTVESGKKEQVHRVSYERFVGPIPAGFQIDHLCKTPACMNPAHLEPVTPRENSLRSDSPSARNARKTHCKRGHPFSGDNLLIGRNGRARVCRACKIENGRQRRAVPQHITEAPHG